MAIQPTVRLHAFQRRDAIKTDIKYYYCLTIYIFQHRYCIQEILPETVQKKPHGHMRPDDIEPDSRVGQVLTQGQWLTLMTIDNNLSLFDFQPNSLLERGNHCLKTASNKWSRTNKALIKHLSCCCCPKLDWRPLSICSLFTETPPQVA